MSTLRKTFYPEYKYSIYIIYLCDFAKFKRCLLSFLLNTGFVQASVAGKKTGAWHLAMCQLKAQAQTYL